MVLVSGIRRPLVQAVQLGAPRPRLSAMPPPLRDPVELGNARTREGRSRAEFYIRDLGGVVRFEGPWRSDEQRAKGDLSTIRAAGASKTERSAAVQAMEQEADRLKDEAKTEASEGGIETVKGGHRARVQYTDSSGSQKKIRGPPRHDERRAQADLETIRAAAVAYRPSANGGDQRRGA